MSSKARRLVQPTAVGSFDLACSAAAHQDIAPGPPHATHVEATSEHGGGAVMAIDDHIADLERDAFAKGFAQGERAGAEAAAAKAAPMLRQLVSTLEEMTAVRANMIRQTERQMVELALVIARRVVHREVAIDSDLLVAMARVALDRLGESARVTVRLHPDEFDATARLRGETWTGRSVHVVPDPRIPRGGCRVESDFGAVDAGVDAQIQELARALLGDDHATRHGGAAA